MQTIAIETTWIVPTTDADVADAVMMARNRGYVENDLQAAFVEEMSFHARECRARYRTANVIEMLLGFESAMGNRWGLKR